MRSIDAGDVSDRLRLKERLGCKSMQWYMDNVFSNSPFALDYLHLGLVKNSASGHCLDKHGGSARAGLEGCHGINDNQIWLFTKEGKIR